MSLRIKAIAKHILPAHIVRSIQHMRSSVTANDIAAAWEFKRQFFWTAFKALDFNGIDGAYAEFGSHSGVTFRLAFDQIRQREIRRHMWSFDSFQGLPEASGPIDNHPRWKKGKMATNIDAFHNICRTHGIPEDGYTVVEGFYDKTLKPMADDTPPTNIALAYIDCDMYSSTKVVLEFLRSRLKHGMILAFDDYFCWSADQVSGERKALSEVFSQDKRWNLIRYRDYGWAGTSFVVESASLSVTNGQNLHA